jgi:hypothetical protein
MCKYIKSVEFKDGGLMFLKYPISTNYELAKRQVNEHLGNKRVKSVEISTDNDVVIYHKSN